MSNIALRDTLLSQADSAFLSLVEQINDLLNAAEFYAERYPIMSKSDELKMKDLQVAVKDLGRLPSKLGCEIENWKRDEERLISKKGVEVDLLGELYITMDATMAFFIREGIDMNYTLSQVKQAYHELIRCNRLL